MVKARPATIILYQTELSHYAIQVISGDCDHPEQIYECIVLHISRFDAPQSLAAALNTQAGTFDYAVNQAGINTPEQYDLRNPEQRARDNYIIDFINIVFAKQQPINQSYVFSQACRQARPLQVEDPREQASD